jgi:hypothetical protein
VPNLKLKHRSFRLTPEPELPLRHRIARGALVIYWVIFFASGLFGFAGTTSLAVIVFCAAVALVFGSAGERLLSLLLLVLAIILLDFVLQFHPG